MTYNQFGIPLSQININHNEVHIWSASILKCKENLENHIAVLSPDEIQRTESYRFSKDKNKFIISRSILRNILSRYIEQSAKDIEFVYGLWGKPSLLRQHNFVYFNASHSGDYVLYAITRNFEIGIDLEYIDKNFDMESLASYFLSPKELEYWRELRGDEQTNYFFSYWAKKEAVLKSSGKGWLKDEIKQIPDFHAINQCKKISNKMKDAYSFQFIPGYASAFFIDGPFLSPIYYSWDQE